MIRLYDNWYQLNDNGIWDKPIRGEHNGKALALLCLGNSKARFLADNDTVVICNCASGYKLKLSDHTSKVQDDIIDALTPYIIQL